MIGWIIAIALLALFLWMKVGIRFRWDSQSSLLIIRVGFLRFSLSTEERKKDGKKKPKKENAAKGKRSDRTQPAADNKKSEKKKGLSPSLKSWIKAVLECWRDLVALIGKVLKSPTLDLIRLHIAVGGSDPEACAMMYGKICAGLGAGMPVLSNIFWVKKQDIDVACRFDLPKMEIMAEVEATVMIYEVFALIGTVLGLLVKIFFTKKRNDKAVQAV